MLQGRCVINAGDSIAVMTAIGLEVSDWQQYVSIIKAAKLTLPGAHCCTRVCLNDLSFHQPHAPVLFIPVRYPALLPTFADEACRTILLLPCPPRHTSSHLPSWTPNSPPSHKQLPGPTRKLLPPAPLCSQQRPALCRKVHLLPFHVTADAAASLFFLTGSSLESNCPSSRSRSRRLGSMLISKSITAL
jgi:hypothetical protein